MTEETKVATKEVAQETRREFAKTTARMALVAPAVFLILNATTKPAQAQSIYTVQPPP